MANAKIYLSQKNLKESEKASTKLRQKFQQHMRECAEKRKERCKQKDTENTMVTQKTSIKISFITCREEFSAKEFCISNDLHVRNNKFELGNTVFCDICISEREDKHTDAGKSGMRHERLAKLDSIISKLGNIAQQSVERELMLGEEFSEIKRTMLVFEPCLYSKFSNSWKIEQQSYHVS